MFDIFGICILLVIFVMYQLFCNAELFVIPYLNKTCTIGQFELRDAKTGQCLFTNRSFYKTPTDSPVPVALIYDKTTFFRRFLLDQDVGLGETYVEKIWNTDDLPLFLSNFYTNFTDCGPVYSTELLRNMVAQSVVSFSKDADKERIHHHYDIGNDFYDLFLTDSFKAYTCGFWHGPDCTLEQAQQNKLDLIIKKIGVRPDQHILDVGCGWGQIAEYVAEKTKCKVTGLTISDEQAKHIQDRGVIDCLHQDWRDLMTSTTHKKFDAIYSIGAMEHFRYENFDKFMRVMMHCLKPGGKMVLHSIVSLTDTPKKAIENGTFITKHIFPGGQIPKHEWIVESALRNGWNLSHAETMGGQHYARTCRAWRDNLLQQENIDYVKRHYSENLLLQFDYYLASCVGAFSAGIMGLGHFVFVADPLLSLDHQYVPTLTNSDNGIPILNPTLKE